MKQNSIVVGLTGQTGAGKTTVSQLLVERGYPVIDADLVARHVVEKGNKCLLDLALEFGIEILDGNGALNRRKLGDMVFGDKAKRAKLNKITFPYIQEEILERIAAYKREGEALIFLDAPTLLESGSDVYCDCVVSIIAPVGMRLHRLLERDRDYTREELESRIAAQHGDEYYVSRSHFILRNDGDETNLRVQLVEMLNFVLRQGSKRATQFKG